MKAPAFDYAAPVSVEEAVALLAEHGDEAKVLAGGQSFVPVLAMRLARPEFVVDINRIDALAGIDLDGEVLRIGTMTRHAAIEHSAQIAAALPLLTRTAPHIGHFQIRNRGTLGGSLAHADSAAEWPAVALALDAEIEVVNSEGARTIPAAEFFVSTFMTSLEAEDLLVAVRFPVWGAGSGYAVEELARRNGDFAIAGTVAGVQVVGGKVARAGIAMLGMGPTPVRLTSMERALVGSDPDAVDLEALARDAVDELDPPADIHAGSHYRKRVASGITARALARALEEATRG